jgi:hypothetical protein
LLELQPDLAIYYGSNDYLYRAVDPDCYRGENPLRGLDPRGQISNFPYDDSLSPFVLYRFLSIQLGWQPNPSTLNSLSARAPIACGQRRPDNAEVNTPLNPPVYYERNLINLIGVARIHNVQLMFSSWAYHEADPEPLPYWRDAIADQNAVMQTVAEQYNVPFIDFAAQASESAELWSDYTHMKYEGLEQQAQAYAAFIVSHGFIPQHPYSELVPVERMRAATN